MLQITLSSFHVSIWLLFIIMLTVPKPTENQTLVVSNLENPISFIIASSSSSGTWSPSKIILPQINTYDFVFEYEHLRLKLQVFLTFKPMAKCLCCWFGMFHVDSTDTQFCKFNCTSVCMHNYIKIWSMWKIWRARKRHKF